MSAISSEPPVAISVARSPAATDFMLFCRPHQAAHHAAADIQPADDKRGGKADEREADQDDPALADLRLGFTNR